MPARERRTERGAATSRRLRAAIGAEIRLDRQSAGVSLREVARVVGCSPATLSRVERGLMPTVSLDLLARICAVVGLDLAAKTYPGGGPLRDRGQFPLLAAFHGRVHRSVGWGTEVPMPLLGDQRRWDAMLRGPNWRYGIEAESAPRDWQALSGRIELKRRDSGVDGVILLLPDTHRTREFLRAAAPLIPTVFPVPMRLLMARLAAGEDPGGSGIVVLRVPRPREPALAVSVGVAIREGGGRDE